jgi:uncharacterized membrane protein YhhN
MNKTAAYLTVTGLLLYILGAALLSTDNNLLSVVAFIAGIVCFRGARKSNETEL